MRVHERGRDERDVLFGRPGGLASDAPVRVLYIGGEGRSGSTLLAALLGNHEGFVPVGELPDVWLALLRKERCGCGEPFSRCPFWTEVGDRAFGGWESVNITRVLEQEERYTRHRRIVRLIMRSRAKERDPAFDAYCELLVRLYRAIREVSGCSVVVDSTKRPPFAMLLSRIPGIELRVIHLVRDSRGVAFSWNKVGIRNIQYSDHPTLKDQPMPTMSPLRSALTWDLKNLLFHVFIPVAQRTALHYERLTTNPSRELDRILEFAGGGAAAPQATLIPAATFIAKPFHTVGGNPFRFTRGRIDVRTDTAWRSEMPLFNKLVVGVLTFPFLIKYGYLRVPWVAGRESAVRRVRRRPHFGVARWGRR